MVCRLLYVEYEIVLYKILSTNFKVFKARVKSPERLARGMAVSSLDHQFEIIPDMQPTREPQSIMHRFLVRIKYINAMLFPRSQSAPVTRAFK